MYIYSVKTANNQQRTNFKSGIDKAASKVIQHNLPKYACETAAALGGAVMVLAAAVNQKSETNTSKDDFQIRKISSNEFIAKANEIINHKNDFKAFKYLDIEGINEWNIQLFDYMLHKPNEYNSTIFRDMVNNMTNSYNDFAHIYDKNSAEVALKMLKMPQFLKSHKYARDWGVSQVAASVSDNKVKDIKLRMLDKLDKCSQGQSFSDTQEVAIIKMLENINTKDGLKVALALMDNPEILNNYHPTSFITQECFKTFANQKEYADIKLELINKINSKPELLKMPYFKHSTTGILNNVTNEESKKFVLKVLDNQELFKSLKFADDLGDMRQFPAGDKDESKAERKIMFDILDTIEKKPELFNNDKFLYDLGKLVFIQKQDDIFISGAEAIENGKKNLFLIENGYYD